MVCSFTNPIDLWPRFLYVLPLMLCIINNMARNLTPPTETEVEMNTRFGILWLYKPWKKLKKSQILESLASTNTFFIFSTTSIHKVTNGPQQCQNENITILIFEKNNNFHQHRGSLTRGFYFFALLSELIFELYQR